MLLVVDFVQSVKSAFIYLCVLWPVVIKSEQLPLRLVNLNKIESE